MSDSTTVEAPIDGILGEVNLEGDTLLDSEKTYFSILADQDSLRRVRENILNYDAYMEFVETLEAGKFGDSQIS